MPFTHIALAGATPSADGWSTGTHIARSLLKRGVKLTVLARKASQNDPEKKKQAEEYVAKGAKVAWVDYSDENELVRALKGVDCVVSTLAVKDPSAIGDAEQALIKAAAKAGVKRFFPSQYGADQSRTPVEKWSPIQHRKNNNKELITKLEMSYTLVVTAMFMDVFWDPLLGFDESKLKAKLIGDGTGKVSCIALKDVGEFVAAMVTAPDTTATENKTIRIGGDHILSGDPIKTFEKVTGKQVEVARVPLETTDPALAFPRLLATSFYDLEGWENGMFPDVKPWTLEQFAREKFGK